MSMQSHVHKRHHNSELHQNSFFPKLPGLQQLARVSVKIFTLSPLEKEVTIFWAGVVSPCSHFPSSLQVATWSFLVLQLLSHLDCIF